MANEDATQHLFEFDDCSYTVDSGGKTKTLLSGISGSVKGGHVLTIMGPSGAGKSVLMKMLTLEKGPGQPTGKIKLDGQAFTQKVYRESCAYVSQIDRHCAFLTAREHLEVSVALYRSELSADQQAAVVDDLLKQMGLESCQHTRAGNEFIRGLSGGQARRLSLAVALSKKPALIFLDEPTSGLDAAAAASIMKFLKQSAATNGTAILCTIHQPSIKVFAGFDDTLILSSGRTAYFGPASELARYLDGICHPVPDGSNPPEHMLDLVNKDFSSSEAVAAVLERYVYKPASPPNAVSLLPQPSQAPFALQMWLLLKKLCKLTYKDPILYVGRVATFLFACAFFAIIYIRARDLSQEHVLSRLFLIMWFVGVPSALGVVAVFALNVDAKAIKREVRDGMYSPVAYVLAHTLLQLPMMLLLALAAVGVPAYGIAAFNAVSFLPFVLVYAVFLWGFECLAQLLSLLPNPLLGMLGFLNLWFTAFLFAGVFLPTTDVIWPFRTLCYMLPIYWAMPVFSFLEFKDYSSVAGAVACDSNTTGCLAGGYYCPGDATGGVQCYGHSGMQVLKSLSVSFDMVDPETDIAYHTCVLCAIGVIFKLVFTVWLVLECKRTAEPKAAEVRPSDNKKISPEHGDALARPAAPVRTQSSDVAAAA